LKLPDGSFSHSDLAIANGKTNQQIWAEYSRLRKEGIIVSAGTRSSSGKGKPTLLWKVADGQPVPLVEKVKVVVVKEIKPLVAHVTATVAKAFGMDKLPASLVNIIPDDELSPVIPFTTAPVVMETIEEDVQPVMVRNLTCQVTEIDAVCPFCKTKLLSIDTARGVKVWCPVNDLTVCSCSENPYGCARNIKDAVEILHDKFFKHRSPTKA
jgi:hypothetical protein